MRYSSKNSLCFGLLTGAAIVGAAMPAFSAEVVVFGDGWLVNGTPALQTSVGQQGLTLTYDDASIFGISTASVAVSPNALADRVDQNPDARWVVLSLGNVDFRRDYASRGPSVIRDDNVTRLQGALAPLFARSPDVRVVLFGSDWPNYTTTSTCQAEADAIFGPGATPAQINAGQQEAVGEAYARVAALDPRVDYIDLFGTLQVAGGLPTAPDVTQPSPAALMFDCVYPDATGFAALTSSLAAAYWGAPRPRAVPMAVPSPACVDVPTLLTNASTVAATHAWRIDGVLTSTQANFMTTFASTGTRTVTLDVANRAFTASAAVTLSVIDCSMTDAGVNDTGMVIDGGVEPDTGRVEPDTGVVIDAGMAADAGATADAAAGPPTTVDRVEIEATGCSAGPRAPVGRGSVVTTLLFVVATFIMRRYRRFIMS